MEDRVYNPDHGYFFIKGAKFRSVYNSEKSGFSDKIKRAK